MRLNLPIIHHLARCNHVLIVGMGNGFDLFSALPIYLELQMLGIQAHMASLSFVNVTKLKEGKRISDTLVGLRAEDQEIPYSPESFLTHWFSRERGEEVPIWCFHKTGAQPLLDNYRLLIEYLNIDGILVVASGHNALMRGNEQNTGRLIEDALNLYAINQLQEIPIKLLSCIGLGDTPDNEINAVFANISRLTQAGAFYGSCALTPQMYTYQSFEQLLLNANAHPLQDPSIINTSILTATRGYYGNYRLIKKAEDIKLWLSPLMPLYWFFDLEKVAESHLYLDQIKNTFTFNEAVNVFHKAHRRLPQQSKEQFYVSRVYS